MKKISIITGCIMMVVAMTSCNKTRRSTGRAYMPDMSYSRAYETYASTEALDKAGVHYTSMPVEGTVARGDMYAYTLKNDSAGYVQSASNKNPLTTDSTAIDMKEAERLYLIYCGICHGEKLDGNGPLWKGGDGPFPNAPKNFMDDAMKVMTEGTMFHSVTYGKNSMGSYASQLNTKQRWQVIAYIKSKQAAVATAKPAADSAKTTVPVKTGK
jgi:mono/diheme cytochrome c family protein